MFGIGVFELIVIAIAALIFVGPKKLPELAKQFGKFFVQIRRMSSDVRQTIDTAVQDAENELIAEERDKIKALLSDNPEQSKPEGSQSFKP